MEEGPRVSLRLEVGELMGCEKWSGVALLEMEGTS